MKTASGLNYETLFKDVVATEGKLHLLLNVPVAMEMDRAWFDLAIPHMKDRIATEKIPGATYERCIEQIAMHSDRLAKAYTKLFETYQYVTTPQTRNGHSAVAAVDSARTDMLSAIKDDKMLRSMCGIYLGADAANEYVLPDDRAQLITATVVAMKEKTDGN